MRPPSLALGKGEALFAPYANAAIHGDYVGVAHLLQVVSSQGRAKASSTIKDQRRGSIGDTFFDVALDDALAQVDGVGEVILAVLAFFTHVDQQEFLAAVQLGFHLIDVELTDPFAGFIDNRQETWGVFRSHASSRGGTDCQQRYRAVIA